MAKIKIDMSNLIVSQKVFRAGELVNLGTGNPNVPGNAAMIAELAAAKNALEAAEYAAEEARAVAKQRTADRDAALERLDAAVINLAGFTQGATGGDPGKILSAGFDLRNPPTRIPKPQGVIGLTVRLNGSPGYSLVTWEAEPVAEGYLLQGSPDPITATSWQTPEISKKTRADANGAAPGEPYWYRVAAFNAAGQGPWSQPASRPVM